MAFSTFRGMMAASKTGSGPVGLTDTYTQEALASVFYYPQQSSGNQAWGFTMNNSGSYLIAYMCSYNGGTVIVDVVYGGTNNKSYCSVANINGGSPIALGTTTGGYSSVTGDSFVNYTAGTYGVVYRTSSTAATFAYLTTSGSTVSVNNNTSAISLTNLYTLACKGFPSQSYAWVLATNTSGTGGIIKVWNYGSGSQQATLSLTSSNININSGYIRMCALTNVLAFACYTVNSSYGVQLVGIDFNGSSTITWNTTVSSGVTVNANSGANCWAINSTTAGLSYFKSGNTTQMFFRTVTVGAGGSITLNTEYSTTVAVAPIGYYAPFDPVNYSGSNWATAYTGIDANVYVVQFSISGNVFTFGTKQYPINGSWSASVNNNFLTGQLVAMDSAHMGAVYLNQLTNRYAVANVLDINNVTQTWTTPVYSTNNFSSSNNYSTSIASNYNTAAWVGGNRFMWFSQNTSANTPVIWTQDVGYNAGNGPSPNYSSQVSVSSVGSSGIAYPLFCPLTYDYTDGNPRMLMLSTTNSNLGYVAVISPGLQATTPSVGTAVSFTASGISTNAYSLINLGPDVSLVVYNGNGGSFANQLAGSVILTSGNTVSTAGTAVQLVSTAGTTNQGSSGSNFQVTAISSTKALLTYSSYTTSGATFGVSMVVLSISGSTITAGTPVVVSSGNSASAKTMGAAVFSGGTSGVVMYPNSANSVMYVAGFTISGTAITLGSQNTAHTFSGATAQQFYCTYFTPIVALNSNQALGFQQGDSGSGTSYFLFTYNNINSITTTTTNLGSAPSGPCGFITTDNNNNYIGFLSSPTNSITMNMVYRS